MYRKTKMESEETKWLKKRFQPKEKYKISRKSTLNTFGRYDSSIPIQKSNQLPSITGYYRSISECILSPEYTHKNKTFGLEEIKDTPSSSSDAVYSIDLEAENRLRLQVDQQHRF